MGAQLPQGLLGRDTKLTQVIRPFERGVELAGRKDGAAALTRILTELVSEGRLPQVNVETTGRRQTGIEALLPTTNPDHTNMWRTSFDDTNRKDLIRLLEKAGGEQETAIRDLVRGFVSTNPKLNGPKALHALQSALETAAISIEGKMSLASIERESFDRAATAAKEAAEAKARRKLGITPEMLRWEQESGYTLIGKEAFAEHARKGRVMNGLAKQKGFANFDDMMKAFHGAVRDAIAKDADYIKFSRAAERASTVIEHYRSVSQQLKQGVDALRSVRKPVFEGAEGLVRQLEKTLKEELHGRKPAVAIAIGAVAAVAVAAAAYYMLKPEEVPKRIEPKKKHDF